MKLNQRLRANSRCATLGQCYITAFEHLFSGINTFMREALSYKYILQNLYPKGTKLLSRNYNKDAVEKSPNKQISYSSVAQLVIPYSKMKSTSFDGKCRCCSLIWTCWGLICLHGNRLSVRVSSAETTWNWFALLSQERLSHSDNSYFKYTSSLPTTNWVCQLN